MIKTIVELIKEWLNEDYEDVKFLSKNLSFVELQNMILNDELVVLCKKAWKKKTTLDYPYVYNNHYEPCEYLSIKAQKLRGVL